VSFLFRFSFHLLRFSLALAVVPVESFCQQTPLGIPNSSPTIKESDPVVEARSAVPEPRDKRIFGIIPNYRTFPSLTEYKPLTSKEKFQIGAQDSFDRGTVVLAAAFAGLGQLTNSTPEFGQGVPGYARYLGTSYGDLVIGDFMTEAIYPTLLHQDPRYFRRGTGSVLMRLGYAMGQIFWTHGDSGGSQFNFSEIGGNSTAVAISTLYYPAQRDTASAASKFGIQIGVDMASNILKEFWPDLSRKFGRRHHPVGRNPQNSK
jgi:hypothetical protein